MKDRRRFLYCISCICCGIGVGAWVGLRPRPSFLLRKTSHRIAFNGYEELAAKITVADIRSVVEDLVAVQKLKFASPDVHVHLIKLLPMAQTIFSDESPVLSFLKNSLEILIVENKWRKSGRRDPLFLKTPWGVTFRTIPSNRPLPYFAITEALSHRDAVLESLVENGLDRSLLFTFGDGTTATIFELVSDSIARFSIPESDTEWSAISYSYLLQENSSWQNRNKERFDFKDVARSLVSNINRVGACFGTHRLIALAHLLFSSALGENAFSEELAKSIREWCQILKANQKPNGSWDTDYLSTPSLEKYPNTGENQVDIEFSVTCHILEFLSLIPHEYLDKMQSVPMIALAIDFFMKTVRDPLYGGLERNVGSSCHGIRAIFNLRSA